MEIFIIDRKYDTGKSCHLEVFFFLHGTALNIAYIS